MLGMIDRKNVYAPSLAKIDALPILRQAGNELRTRVGIIEGYSLARPDESALVRFLRASKQTLAGSRAGDLVEKYLANQEKTTPLDQTIQALTLRTDPQYKDGYYTTSKGIAVIASEEPRTLIVASLADSVKGTQWVERSRVDSSESWNRLVDDLTAAHAISDEMLDERYRYINSGDDIRSIAHGHPDAQLLILSGNTPNYAAAARIIRG